MLSCRTSIILFCFAIMSKRARTNALSLEVFRMDEEDKSWDYMNGYIFRQVFNNYAISLKEILKYPKISSSTTSKRR